MARTWPGGDASTRIANQSVSWANSDLAATEKLIDLGSPDAVSRQPSPGLLVIVRNPSTETDLAGEVRVRYDDGGTTRYATLGTFTATRANGDGQAFLIDGGLLAAGGQVSLKNAAQVGGSGAFSARVVVYAF